MLEYKHAGFWRRFFAYIIDIITMILSIILGIVVSAFAFTGSEIVALMFLVFIVGALFLYHPLFHSSEYRATPGQQALGIKVLHVNIDKSHLVKSGEKLSFLRALSRSLVYEFMNYTVVIGIISALFMIFTKRKQGLHDIICNTIVVRADKVQEDTSPLLTSS